MRFKQKLIAWLQGNKSSLNPLLLPDKTTGSLVETVQASVIRANSALMQQAMAHWQMADWQALIALSADAVAQDEKGAEIAILLSVAFNQLGEGQQGRYWAEQAKAWGADKQFMKRALLSGAMNSVANVALLDAKQVGLTPKSLRWLEQSAKVSLGDSAVPALVKARAENQLRHLQLSIEQ